MLVEQADRLGGFVSTLKKRFPTAPPYTELTVDGVAAQIESVSYHPKIQVLTKAKILETSGQPGMFDVTVATEAGEMRTRVGSIVMATGWKPYDATKLGHLGYGLSPDVVTNVELERMVAAGPIARPSDGKAVQSVLFVQCAGSRDTDHLAYCSSVCCMASLKHAAYVHEQNPDAQVYIIYKDIRTPGQYERFYRAAQDHPLNFLTKGEVAGVEIAEGGTLAVTVKDSLVGETVRITVDLVVLATGMVPNAADGVAIRAVKDARATLARADASEPQKVDARKKIETLAHHEGTEILNLTYRQGPDLPAFRYGFPDSHFVCFPYETRRTGIYAAGTVRSPMDAAHAQEDAAGAMLKAIQSVELDGPGRGGTSARRRPLVSQSFFLQRCTQCKRCTEECPFGTLDEDAKGTPQLNAYRCRRCGVCMGACPERIISFKNYSVDMIASMIKAIEVPEEEDEKPRVILLFMCENDAYPALDVAGLNRVHYDPSVRVIPLRCLGSLNIVWIADALSGGHRRHHARRLQVRRRLPVPLHAGQRAGQPPAGEREGDAAAAPAGVGPDQLHAVGDQRVRQAPRAHRRVHGAHPGAGAQPLQGVLEERNHGRRPCRQARYSVHPRRHGRGRRGPEEVLPVRHLLGRLQAGARGCAVSAAADAARAVGPARTAWWPIPASGCATTAVNAATGARGAPGPAMCWARSAAR